MKQSLDIIIQQNKAQILAWIEEKKTKTWMANQLNCDRGSFSKDLIRNGISYQGAQGGPDYSIQNKTFGNLIALRPVSKEELSGKQLNSRGQYWYCQCKNCGKNTIVKASSLKSGHTIGDGCQRSKGELKIMSILKDANINYVKEYVFQECIVNTQPARFDFAILKDSKVKYLIEYDGKQHFEDTFSLWQDSQEVLEKRKRSDKIKTTFCFNNNIPLIRIPYTLYDSLSIEDLLLETSKYILLDNKKEV